MMFLVRWVAGALRASAAIFSSRAWERLHLGASDEEITVEETSTPIIVKATETKPGRLLAIKDGILVGDKTSHKPSPRNSGSMTGGKPCGVIAHWTATARGTAKNIQKSWTNKPKPDQHVGSAHGTIEDDGTWFGSIPFHIKAWHAGSKTAKLPPGAFKRSDGKPTGYNDIYVGIEITNIGRVAKRKDRNFRGWAEDLGVGYGPVVPDDQVFMWRGRYYQRWTAEQLETFATIAYLVANHYGIPYSRICESHVDVDPKRKEDNGPFWAEVVAPLLLSGTHPATLAKTCTYMMDKGSLK